MPVVREKRKRKRKPKPEEWLKELGIDGDTPERGDNDSDSDDSW